MIHVPERIGIIGGSGIYDINKEVKPLTSRIRPNVVSRFDPLILLADIGDIVSL